MSKNKTVYLTANQFAEKHGKNPAYVLQILRKQAKDGVVRIRFAKKVGRTWMIPSSVKYPNELKRGRKNAKV